MKSKKTNIWTIVILISLTILIVMGLISNALEIGERLGRVHFSLEILFYILILVVVLGGIVYPVVSIFMAPIFSLKDLHNAEGKARQKWCKKLVKNLLENVELTPEEEAEVKVEAKAEAEAECEELKQKTREEVHMTRSQVKRECESIGEFISQLQESVENVVASVKKTKELTDGAFGDLNQ